MSISPTLAILELQILLCGVYSAISSGGHGVPSKIRFLYSVRTYYILGHQSFGKIHIQLLVSHMTLLLTPLVLAIGY